MQQPSFALESNLTIRAERADGIDRLFLAGELDVFTAPILQREIDAVVHSGSSLVLDLDGLTFVDRFGVHSLERAAGHAGRDAWRLELVGCRGAVRQVFETAGAGHLFRATDLDDSGDGDWPAISLPSLHGRRDGGPRRKGRP